MKVETNLILDNSDIFEALRLFVDSKGLPGKDVCNYSVKDVDGSHIIIVQLAQKKV